MAQHTTNVDTQVVIQANFTTNVDTIVHILDNTNTATNSQYAAVGQNTVPITQTLYQYVTVYHHTNPAKLLTTISSQVIPNQSVIKSIQSYISAAQGFSLTHVRGFINAVIFNMNTSIKLWLQCPTQQVYATVLGFVGGVGSTDRHINLFITGSNTQLIKHINSYIAGGSNTTGSITAMFIASAPSVTTIGGYISS